MIGRVASPLFVGRREELAVLEGAVDSAAGGNGAVVMIGGEAGMGKSRLVAQLGGLASAAARPWCSANACRSGMASCPTHRL
ncbi:MAG TPA: ATP-binding protein [Solirubrobacteraceae bacterium]|nr:ATP-binding protein [Solirubrobacteraceae bacterium]